MDDPIEALIEEVKRRTVIRTPQEIRRIRQESGVSLRRFAEALDVNAMTVSRWERGVSQPRPVVAQRLERLLSGLESVCSGVPTVVSPPTLSPDSQIAEVFEAYVGNALQRSGLRTLGEVAQLSERDLRAIRNFGQRSTEAVIEALARAGLALAEDDRRPPFIGELAVPMSCPTAV